MAFPYQLRIIQRQQQLVSTITQGSELERRALGMYVREWQQHLQEVCWQRTGLSRHQLPRIEQALAQLEGLRQEAHLLAWQQVQARLLTAAALLG
ncbi:hypothetical protein [Hymenobacter pini]|uniref:hypothetical protein n=1 Tax=Hymenobacter pini TaxID=2880879 RepID=UPI001CF34913|nr:hypothetical protein [Hymenobacter pini]MCA8830476.1 hypothetical protein [Hymenobacter pini]